ncbi:hypothetical protein SNEBB_003879 [Seison nebaliae]|nr:hypothetical protein SNEBB_003879 [Seison nebaliae]
MKYYPKCWNSDGLKGEDGSEKEIKYSLERLKEELNNRLNESKTDTLKSTMDRRQTLPGEAASLTRHIISSVSNERSENYRFYDIEEELRNEKKNNKNEMDVSEDEEKKENSFIDNDTFFCESLLKMLKHLSSENEHQNDNKLKRHTISCLKNKGFDSDNDLINGKTKTWSYESNENEMKMTESFHSLMVALIDLYTRDISTIDGRLYNYIIVALLILLINDEPKSGKVNFVHGRSNSLTLSKNFSLERKRKSMFNILLLKLLLIMESDMNEDKESKLLYDHFMRHLHPTLYSDDQFIIQRHQNILAMHNLIKYLLNKLNGLPDVENNKISQKPQDDSEETNKKSDEENFYDAQSDFSLTPSKMIRKSLPKAPVQQLNRKLKDLLKSLEENLLTSIENLSTHSTSSSDNVNEEEKNRNKFVSFSSRIECPFHPCKTIDSLDNHLDGRTVKCSVCQMIKSSNNRSHSLEKSKEGNCFCSMLYKYLTFDNHYEDQKKYNVDRLTRLFLHQYQQRTNNSLRKKEGDSLENLSKSKFHQSKKEDDSTRNDGKLNCPINVKVNKSNLENHSNDDDDIESKKSCFENFFEMTKFSPVTHSTHLIDNEDCRISERSNCDKQINDVDHYKENGTVQNIEKEIVNDRQVKHKMARNHYGNVEFDQLELVQEIKNAHSSVIWCMKFSLCGRLLATGGRDALIKLWMIPSTTTSNDDMICLENTVNRSLGLTDEQAPFRLYRIWSGHSSDIVDLSWSKTGFLLSTSFDDSVKLWHRDKNECLVSFQHDSLITAVAFFPEDDRYFTSCAFDGRIRIWDIEEKVVCKRTEVSNVMTAVTHFQQFLLIGTSDGRVVAYKMRTLEYEFEFVVRSSKGKNRRGSRICGLSASYTSPDILMVTSSDSRIRLYNMREKTIQLKFKGFFSRHKRIQATFSPDERFIICGSEDHCIYIWDMANMKWPIHSNTIKSKNIDSFDLSFSHNNLQETSYHFQKRNVFRNGDGCWERLKIHNNTVISAIFAPNPLPILQIIAQRYPNNKLEDSLITDNLSIENNVNREQLNKLLKPSRLSRWMKKIVTVKPKISDKKPIESTHTTTSHNINRHQVIVSSDANGNIRLCINRFKTNEMISLGKGLAQVVKKRDARLQMYSNNLLKLRIMSKEQVPK